VPQVRFANGQEIGPQEKADEQGGFKVSGGSMHGEVSPASLRDILARLHSRLKNPDYNYVIVTSPHYKADEPQLHWYLQIRPRLTTRAAFEIGSGISINPSLPEADADFLNMEE
jgi:hypothetical protein